MIWFFDRDGEKLRYEISHDRAAGRYKVVITHPDGRESVEEVEEPTELIERSVQLMNSLRGEGWRVGGRMVPGRAAFLLTSAHSTSRTTRRCDR